MGNDCLGITADFPNELPHRVFLEPLVQTPPSPRCEVCVIVPARNEAENLESTLAALSQQIDLQGQSFDPTRYEIILLANNCSDDSAAIARRFAKHPITLHIVEKTLPAEEAYIGRVRQILMDEAYPRSQEWSACRRLLRGEAAADRAGRAALDPYTRACHLREVGYRYLIAELETYLDADPYDIFPRHYQHYGASLAVTAEMYKQAGGMPPVRTPEDVAFYRSLVRVNARFRHSPLVRVTTSARKTGRTNIGLANQLNEWAAMGRQNQAFLVESVAEIETRLQARHQLRVLWWRILNDQPSYKDIAPLANTLGVASQWLMSELAQPHTFGLLWERVEQRQQEEGIWCQCWSKVRIEVAIAHLRLRLDSLRRGQTFQQICAYQPKRASVGCVATHPEIGTVGAFR